MEGGKILCVFQHCVTALVGCGEEQRKVSAGSWALFHGSRVSLATLALASQALIPGLWCSHCHVWPAEHLCGQALAVYEGSSQYLELWAGVDGLLTAETHPGAVPGTQAQVLVLCQAGGLMAAALFPQPRNC